MGEGWAPGSGCGTCTHRRLMRRMRRSTSLRVRLKFWSNTTACLEALHKVAPGGAALQRAGSVVRAGRHHVRPRRLCRAVAADGARLRLPPLLLLLGLAGCQLQQLGARPLDVGRPGRGARLHKHQHPRGALPQLLHQPPAEPRQRACAWGSASAVHGNAAATRRGALAHHDAPAQGPAKHTTLRAHLRSESLRSSPST